MSATETEINCKNPKGCKGRVRMGKNGNGHSGKCSVCRGTTIHYKKRNQPDKYKFRPAGHHTP